MELLGELNPDTTTNVEIPRVTYEWNDRVVVADPNHVAQGPLEPYWYVPDTYGDPVGEKEVLAKIEKDFGTAVDLAIRWKTLGDIPAAIGCVNILTAWADQKMPVEGEMVTGALAWCTRWPLMILASLMVSDFSGYTRSLDGKMRQLTIAGKSLSLAYTNSGNTAVWGTVLEISSAVFLDDRISFDKAIRRWRYLFNEDVVNNVPIKEVYRQGGGQGDGRTGLWYSNFLVYAFTMAAEWARFNGEWLYDYTGTDGSTFKGLVMKVRGWTRHPETFIYNTSPTPATTIRSLPHDQVLHSLWPTDESQWIVDEFPTGDDRDSSGIRNAALVYRNRPLYG